MKLPKLTPFLAILLLAASSFSPLPAAVTWQSKVDPSLRQAASSGPAEFIVYLSAQANLSRAAFLQTKLEKGRYVFEQLTEMAKNTQPAVLADLAKLGVEARPYWVANMIWVRGGSTAIQAIAKRPDVAHLYANPQVRLEQPIQEPAGGPGSSLTAGGTAEWNVAKIGAPEVWAAGITGQGVVIGGQDTGYDWTHPALKTHYRGWDGSTADHNYNWHDAIHSGGGVKCGFDAKAPCDDGYHGTHTMGIMVGDDGGSNKIGVAPGAKWIGCRNMDQGKGSPATYSECYQWFLAPTDLNGQNPRPDLAPDVIDNSWGCPAEEGCTDPNVLLAVVNNVRAAGILTVHSAGNDGFGGCGSVNTPGAIYDSSFTVGSTNSNDMISGTSSRGPVTVDGSGRLKPDIVAPGVNILSSVTGGGYASHDGTSMAAPHVVGLAALLISANPKLNGKVDELERLIELSAVPMKANDSCGSTSGKIPNNTYGWGRINAWSAYSGNFLEINNSASSSIIKPGETLTYTLTISHTALLKATNGIVVSDALPTNTTFVSANPQPYNFDGSSVSWNFPSMEPFQSLTMQITIQIQGTANGIIENENYSVKSNEVPIPVTGDPVITTTDYQLLLPQLFHP